MKGHSTEGGVAQNSLQTSWRSPHPPHPLRQNKGGWRRRFYPGRRSPGGEGGEEEGRGGGITQGGRRVPGEEGGVRLDWAARRRDKGSH